MSTEGDIIDHLAGDTDVTDIVGSRLRLAGSVEQKITVPFLSVREISTVDHDVSEGSSGQVNSRVQIDCYDTTPNKAKILALAIKVRLKNVRNPTGIAGTTIKSILPDGRRDAFDVDEGGGYSGQPGVQQDFSVWFKEATS